MARNRSLIYKKLTLYEPVAGVHLVVEDLKFDPEQQPPPGGIIVKNSYLSLDPYERGQIRSPSDSGTYSTAWVEGEPAIVTAISTVLKSDNERFKPGDMVTGFAAAGEYATVPPEVARETRLIPAPPPGVNISPSTLLGALGISGLSAYVSFFEYVSEPRAGKTMVISAASGGVGQVVGQIAKMYGMKVIGSTGSMEKVAFLVKELGFDGAWDYKTEPTADALRRLTPEGLDVYYDNVGGEQLETALTHMKDFGTIVVSGMVSQYNLPDRQKYGVRTLMNIAFHRLTLHGFICSDKHLFEKYSASFAKDMVTWLVEGKIKTKEEVVSSIENAPEAFVKMLRGDKFGKMVPKLD